MKVASAIDAVRRRPTAAASAGVAALASIVLPIAFIGLCSSGFEQAEPPEPGPVAFLIGALTLAGMAFLIVFGLVRRGAFERRLFLIAISAGAAARVVLLFSTPVLEDDWRRYLWDGAVVAAGLDPYAHPPAAALDRADAVFPEFEHAQKFSPEIERLRALGAGDPSYPEKVNHPYLTTVYPPVAQGVFFVSNRIAPFNLTAWRVVLIIADAATMLLLLHTLAAYGRARALALLYWLNPVVIFEIYNAAHVDALIGPFLLAALLFSKRCQAGRAGLALALAAGVKLWPLILAPIFARRFEPPAKALFFTATFAGCALAILTPQLLHVGRGADGLTAYAEDWENNAFLFAQLSKLLEMASADGAARLVVAVIMIAAVAGLAAQPDRSGADLPRRALIAATILFFLSPTGYPWYAISLFALWPFAPAAGFAALTMTLPLYHFRFISPDIGYVVPPSVLAVEFGAPLLVFAIEAALRRRLR